MTPFKIPLHRLAVLVLLLGCGLAAAGAADPQPDGALQAGDGAAALDAGDPPPQRQLQQVPDAADCARSVPNCEQCRYQFYRCAPGYYKNATSGACQPCGEGFYCQGAKATEESGAARLACGANKVTTTTYGRSDRECVVLPGYGWEPGDGALKCAQGWYNPGYNTRKCTRCAGSLTTSAEGTAVPQECKAPAGHFFRRGNAVACAQGTYKEGIGNWDCAKCPEGWTTQLGAPARTSPQDCAYVLPGFYAPAGLASVLGAPEAEAPRCPPNTYRGSEAQYGALEDAAGLNCTACPTGLQTLGEASTVPSQCLAPPGSGFDAGAGTAALCGRGSYNPGWNRQPCVLCGAGNYTSDTEGSASADDCKIPAGFGSSRGIDGGLVAAACAPGTYGREADTYGLVEVECTKCLQYSTTAGAGSTTGAQCLTLGGYGWYNGAIWECDYAHYSTGNHQDPCSYCGEGYNTSTGAGGTAPVTGATGVESCVIAAGWTGDGGGGVKPCMQGFYKSLLGPSGCVKCPDGTTTTITFAPAELSDCDACRPGFGVPPDGAVDLSAPACGICDSGTYSFGYVSGGAACTPCERPDGYAGDMVSRRGLSNPDECYPEFMTEAAYRSLLRYNHVPMDASVFTTSYNGTAADCEADCHDAAGCQYYLHRDLGAAGTSCALRDLGVAPAAVGDDAGSHILFQISAGVYVAYSAHPTDWASAGVTLGSFGSRAAAEASCNTAAACVGLKSSAGAWRTFGGALLSGATAKVRINGVAINAWLPEPSAN
ncbi:MAG: hypothetical protein J3K34DRAFT_523791 [Monoraphidium minutum]|nr:MAG: hypothetical protein J3K34DRAFT_523791 [Monoraphidium minutum]